MADEIQEASAWGYCENRYLDTEYFLSEKKETHLPDHNAAVPPLRLRFLHTRPESSRVHEPVRRVCSGGGLADDELVERDAVLGDLEERRAGEGAAGLGQQARAVAVQTLVVELDVVLCTGAELDLEL